MLNLPFFRSEPEVQSNLDAVEVEAARGKREEASEKVVDLLKEGAMEQAATFSKRCWEPQPNTKTG